MSKLSVIICTHNPRNDYLSRVLAALRAQTFPLDEWELIVVDNVSDPPVARKADLSWHPSGRIVTESELGLTPARLTGIRESVGDILVFVDDDNVLRNDYLAEVVRLCALYPCVGALGASTVAEFEVAPSDKAKPFLDWIGVKQVSREYWCNLTFEAPINPIGAGLVVRRQVAEHYRHLTIDDPVRRTLDRKGRSLAGCGDIDLAYCAVDVGLGHGVFPSLHVTHLIPAFRMDVEYLTRAVEESMYSHYVLGLIRGRPVPKASLLHGLRGYLRYIRADYDKRVFLRCNRRAHQRAVEFAAAARRSGLTFPDADPNALR